MKVERGTNLRCSYDRSICSLKTKGWRNVHVFAKYHLLPYPTLIAIHRRSSIITSSPVKIVDMSMV